MSKRHAVKYKISRRLGESLWGRAKDPVNRRSYGPGQHGAAASRKKPSDYKNQLLAKQKLKAYYGNLTEKQFFKLYQEAIRMRGDTSENMIGLLERRLDSVIYRMCVVPTPFAARQFVNHGHIKVNGRRVNIPSYLVKEGDVIEVKDKSKELALVVEAMASPERDVPDYIDMDEKAVKATFTRTPKLSDVPYPVKMEPNLVVEFYSR
jgi:small subunit ribosomal protein S4